MGTYSTNRVSKRVASAKEHLDLSAEFKKQEEKMISVLDLKLENSKELFALKVIEEHVLAILENQKTLDQKINDMMKKKENNFEKFFNWIKKIFRSA